MCKAIVLNVVVVVHALESEIENGRMNVCRSEEASRLEKWNESSVGRIEISILTTEYRMEVSSVEWKFGICRIVMDGHCRLPYHSYIFVVNSDANRRQKHRDGVIKICVALLSNHLLFFPFWSSNYPYIPSFRRNDFSKIFIFYFF